MAEVDVKHVCRIFKGVFWQLRQANVAGVETVDGAVLVEQITWQLVDCGVDKSNAVEAVV